MLLNNRNLFTSGCKKTGTPGVPDCQENSRKNTEIFFTVWRWRRRDNDDGEGDSGDDDDDDDDDGDDDGDDDDDDEDDMVGRKMKGRGKKKQIPTKI